MSPIGKARALFVAAGLLGMAWMWVYGGWLTSKPIDRIGDHELSNLPPPSYARSFSVNHGQAIYYRDGPPSEHPVKRTVAGVLLVACGLLGIGSFDRLRRLRRPRKAARGQGHRGHRGKPPPEDG